MSQSKYKDPKLGTEYEVLDNVPLTEWLLDQYKNYVDTLEIVTDKSPEGNQFSKGFGGIGGILRYKIDMVMGDDENNNNDFDEDDFI